MLTLAGATRSEYSALDLQVRKRGLAPWVEPGSGPVLPYPVDALPSRVVPDPVSATPSGSKRLGSVALTP